MYAVKSFYILFLQNKVISGAKVSFGSGHVFSLKHNKLHGKCMLCFVDYGTEAIENSSKHV